MSKRYPEHLIYKNNKREENKLKQHDGRSRKKKLDEALSIASQTIKLSSNNNNNKEIESYSPINDPSKISKKNEFISKSIHLNDDCQISGSISQQLNNELNNNS